MRRAPGYVPGLVQHFAVNEAARHRLSPGDDATVRAELPFEGSKPTPLASNLIGKPAVH
jgi:hypothetical protein